MSNTREPLLKVEFDSGDTLFKEGQPAKALFVVNRGSVLLTKKVHSIESQLEILGEGDVLGESAFFANEHYKITAVALENTTCLRINGEDFGKMIGRSPDIALRIMRKVCSRLVHLQYKLSNFTLRVPLARLMHQLLAESKRAKSDSNIPIPFDLPEALAMERGAVDEMMRMLINQSLITIDEKGRFNIPDMVGYHRCLTFMELKDRFDHLKLQ